MAMIHHTTMTPTKLELLSQWLPRQPWYQGDGTTDLRRAGGFRLDDPEGQVGIEFMVVTDGPIAYHVPMTYRGAPLEGAEHALIGTSEHGVLGTRWLYDGIHDPVLRAQLTALLRGQAQPQMQSVSDTPDPTVASDLAADAPEQPTVAIVRVLRSGDAPADALGSVTADWTLADGTAVRGLLVRA
jgi:hypothetical protein